MTIVVTMIIMIMENNKDSKSNTISVIVEIIKKVLVMIAVIEVTISLYFFSYHKVKNVFLFQ